MEKRVCAYARVSTNSKSQEHSFEFQSEYWNRTLSKIPNFKYVGLYADKGISGRFAERRPQFMSMVNAVKEGKIDFIFTKSVQRFARNTQELLSIVRMFRDMGVGVYFEKENLNTLQNDSDLYLTIAAAVAEDDLSRYSQNVVWSIKDKFKKGEPIVNGRFYGFKMGVGIGNKFEIIEEEADIIRRIYSLYLDGASMPSIVKTLNSEDIKSPNGGKWGESAIARVLSNEKYCGDCLLQKNYLANGVQVENRGEKDQYFVENHHNPIVSKEIWNLVQQEREKRRNNKLYGGKISPYPFTKLIICGHCGKYYRHKVNKSLYSKDFEVWMCPSGKDNCPAVRIKDTELKAKFVSAFNEFVTNKYRGDDENNVQKEIDEYHAQQDELYRLRANGWISIDDFSKELKTIQKELEPLNEKLMKYRLRNFSDKDFKPLNRFEENRVHKFLTKVVIRGFDINFHFYNDVVITRQIEQTRVYEKDRLAILKEN